MNAYSNASLATIDHGEVPESRIEDAQSAQDYARRLIDNDAKRAYKRARVNGLVDGNPPYQAAKLRAAGRADACNANWGIGRAMMESGCGAFYDLFGEAPGVFGIRTSYGTEEEREVYSRIMMEEADRCATNDDVFDYNMQISQWEMVLHGCGPFMFEDAFCVFPRAFQCGDLKVPEFTKADTTYWEGAIIQARYYPPELYAFIEDPDFASQVGWNVEYTKKVIENAMDIRTEGGVRYDWELYQQELKNNSLSYYDDSKVSWLCHIYWEEFDQTITHAIVPRDTAASVRTEYCFFSRGRYNNWKEFMHPMYYDRGNGGFHHSVTGLGVKMYSAMEYQNRLLCNLADKAFAPKILFKPTSTEASQRFSLAHFGDYGVMPANFEWGQTGIAGLSNEGLAMNQEVNNIMQSNLSAYRQGSQMKQEGNPVTARQVSFDASQQAAVSKTSYSRYYKQLDLLFTEIIRRMFNLNSADKRAQEVQERCIRRGVPKEAMGRIEKVEAIRVIGQGSAFMRRESINALLPIAGALPEDGRDKLISDKIAAEAGQAAVRRYYPKTLASRMGDEQHERAMNQVADMKVGVPPVITPSQNPSVFAMTFLQAAAQSFQSLQQGGNPYEVLAFVEQAGPAIAAHLQRFAKDPTRAALAKTLGKQWKQLSEMTDLLKKQLAQQQQKQAQGQQKQGEAMSDIAIKGMKAQSDIKLKEAKTQASIRHSEMKTQAKLAQDKVTTRQKLALDDAKTAADIHRTTSKTAAEIQHQRAKTATGIQHERAETVAGIHHERAKTAAQIENDRMIAEAQAAAAEEGGGEE